MSVRRCHAILFALITVVVGCAVVGCAGANANAEPTPDPLDSIEGAELYRRGRLLAGAGDYIRAEQYLAAAIERGHPEEEAIPLLLHVCVQASRLVAALDYAEPFLAHHPNEWTLRMLVASIHLALRHHDRAQAELERVIEDAAEEPAQAHYLLGVLFRDGRHNIEDARVHFRRYLALAPEGDHHEEARAALTPEERGVPRRIERGESSPPEGAVPVREPTDAPEGDEAPETTEIIEAPSGDPS